MRVFIIAGLSALLFSFILLSCSSSGLPGQSKFEDGYEYLADGNVEKAKELFEELFAEFPDSPYGPHGLAVYYESERLVYSALKYNNKSLKLDPKFKPGLLLSTKLTDFLERPELSYYSIGLYREAGGDSVLATDLEAGIWIDAGKVDEANMLFKEALPKIENTPEIKARQAFIDLHEGNIKSAFKNINAAVKLDKENYETLKRAGDFYRIIGLSDSAYLYYISALNANTDNFEFKKMIAEALIDMNYNHEADKILNEYMSSAGTTHWYCLNKAKIFRNLGYLYQAETILGVAMPLYRNIPKMMTDYADFNPNKAGKLGAMNYYETAVDIIGTKDFPSLAHIEISLRRVESLIEMMQVNRAGYGIDDIRDSLPNDFRALVNISTLFWIFEKQDSVEVYYRQLSSLSDGVPAKKARLAELYARMGDLGRTREFHDAATSVDKFSVQAICAMADAFTKNEKYQDALSYLNALDDYFIFVPEIRERYLELLRLTVDTEAALQFAENSIAIAVHDLSRYKQASEIAENSGDIPKAIEIYQLMTTNNPENKYAHYILAQYAYDLGMEQIAAENNQTALSIDSTFADAIVLDAYMLYDKGELEIAIERLKKGVELDQYNYRGQAKLALAMVDTDENPMIAFNYANKALRADDTKPISHFAKGMAHFKAEKYNAARVSFSKAVELGPDEATYLYYSGLNFYLMGDKNEGRKLIRSAHKMGLPSDLETEAEKYL